MHEKEHLMLEGMLMDRSFNDAYNTPPIGPFHYNGERSLLHNYERVYARLSRSVGIDEIENLSKYPDLKESGFAFLDDLEVSCQKSQALKDPQILKDFLRDYKTPIEKIKNGELGQEFLIFAFVLENIVKPVLDSPAYEKDFKINRNAFVGGVEELSREFRYGKRAHFMFHADGAFQVRKTYVANKTLGISNAIVLFGMQMLNKRW